MSTIMIALVGDQPMPNIIAALQHKPRPDTLYLLHTGGGFRRVAQNTKRVLEKCFGFDDAKIELKKIPAFDTAKIQATCRKLAEMATPGDRVVFNTTGGTKLMSLAASQVAGELADAGQVDLCALYVESDQRQIIFLEPLQSQPHLITLRDLKVEHYLEAHGVSLRQDRDGTPMDCTNEATSLPHHLREAARYLAEGATENYQALGLLRYWLGNAECKYNNELIVPPRRSYATLSAEIAERNWPSVPEDEFLRLLHDLSSPSYSVFQLIEHSNGELELEITGRQCKFIKGDWLEFYVFHEALRQDFDDRRIGLKIKWRDRWRRLEETTGKTGDATPKNELDVVVMQNIQLTICSCKSGWVAKEAMYELETIARSVGLYCGKVLAIARPKRARDVSDNLIRRALILGIVPVTAENLTSIGEILVDPNEHLWVMRQRV